MKKKTISISDFRSALQSEYLKDGSADYRAQNLSDGDLAKQNIWTDLGLDSLEFVMVIVALERLRCLTFKDDGEGFAFMERRKNRRTVTVKMFLDFANTQIEQ